MTSEYNLADLVASSEIVMDGLPVLGWPGINFYAIHYSALTSIVFSILASMGVIIYIAILSKIRFHSKPVGERLVVYLALSDLGYR